MDAEAVELAERQSSSTCSPVVCILSVCLCLVLAALIAITVLHTHAKLNEGCELAGTSFTTPCDLQQRRFNVSVGNADACNDWKNYACGNQKQTEVTHHQLLVLGAAKAFCHLNDTKAKSELSRLFNASADIIIANFDC